MIQKLILLKKEVTQGPKPLGAQLPYESDPFEPGNLVLRPVPKTSSVYLVFSNASREIAGKITFFLRENPVLWLFNLNSY